MTEPKHIPLPKERWSDSAVERLVHWLQTPDEALVPLDDDVTEEEPEVWGGGCECWVTPEPMWTEHYGAVEPGSQLEFNPDCPKHGTTADDAPEPSCNGICITAAEVGVIADGVAYAHPDCELHGGVE